MLAVPVRTSTIPLPDQGSRSLGPGSLRRYGSHFSGTGDLLETRNPQGLVRWRRWFGLRASENYFIALVARCQVPYPWYQSFGQ